MLIYDLPKRRLLPDEVPCASVGNEFSVRFSVDKQKLLDGQQKPRKPVGYGKNIHINWQCVIAIPKAFHPMFSINSILIMFVPTNPYRPGVILNS